MTVMPGEILPILVRRDASAPVITYYDDATGERIELSAKVLSMWAAKAAHWLLDEMLIEPGQRVSLRLPARHWRSIYWAFGVWSLGATVVTTDDDFAEAVVSMDGSGDLSEPEASLGVSEITGFPDTFGTPITAAVTDLALNAITYGELVSEDPGAARTLLTHTDSAQTLAAVAAVLSGGGSVVLVRGEDRSQRDRRCAQEGIQRVVG